jgi:hypothetical protein
MITGMATSQILFFFKKGKREKKKTLLTSLSKHYNQRNCFKKLKKKHVLLIKHKI